jgi:2-deoxy-D-gluconate 3-dehydrogenase
MNDNLFSLEGRRAIVTGGGGDIGGGLTSALAEAGATVAIIGRSDDLAETAAGLGGKGRVHAVRGDLSDRDATKAIFDEAVGVLGGLDILVACHGLVKAGDVLTYEQADWDATLEANLTSVFRLCQLAGERMIEQGRGKIITIASMLTFFGGFRAAAYAASKGGLGQFTKALANEWAPKGINVNAIAPGYIQTKMNRHIWQDPTRNQQILARLPSGRWGTPADLKGAVVFLASPASDYLHGVILPVDGGFLAR